MVPLFREQGYFTKSRGEIMKLLMSVAIVTSLLAMGCLNGVASPGSDIRSGLPEKTNTIEDAWPGSAEILLTQGCPVSLDTYTAVHGVSGSGIIVIEVRSHDFDPIAVLLDSDDNQIAFNDDWLRKTTARLVVEDIPSGARLLVFSPDDSRGLYDVLVREGTQSDLDEFTAGTDLRSGTVRGAIDNDSYDAILDRTLRETLSDDVYIQNYATARLYPFTVEESDGLVSLLLESVEFDTFLALLEVKGNSYRFLELSDDYLGSDSRIISALEPGNYIALVMSYSMDGEGDFTLALEILDENFLDTTPVEAPNPGQIYTGSVEDDRNYALGWWPGMEENWEVPGFLTPFTPVVGFVFGVETMAVYEVNAFGDLDVCLTLLRLQDDAVELISSSDDFAGLGSDARIIEPLPPGDYAALVSLYSAAGGGEVSFYWQEPEVPVESLRQGRTVDVRTDYETELHMFSLDLLSGRSYTISAESEEIDPVITVILGDGTRLTDDDGGEDTNSLLSFSTDEGQGGECYLLVTKYSGGDGTISVRLEDTGAFDTRMPY
jgi:hypothetical protein